MHTFLYLITILNVSEQYCIQKIIVVNNNTDIVFRTYFIQFCFEFLDQVIFNGTNLIRGG